MKKSNFIRLTLLLCVILLFVWVCRCNFTSKENNNPTEPEISECENIDDMWEGDTCACDSSCAIDVMESVEPIIDEVDELEIPANNPETDKY